MELKINERYVKFSRGKIPIRREIAWGEEVILAIKAGLVKIEESDNQDGTKDATYIIKAIELQFDK